MERKRKILRETGVRERGSHREIEREGDRGGRERERETGTWTQSRAHGYLTDRRAVLQSHAHVTAARLSYWPMCTIRYLAKFLYYSRTNKLIDCALFDKSTKIGIEFDMLKAKLDLEMETSANGLLAAVWTGLQIPGGYIPPIIEF